jgi:hypothetical protein
MPVYRHAHRSFADRRRYPRFPVRLRLHYLSLKIRDHGHLQEGVTHDVALGGLAMRCHQALEAGQQLMINLFLPAPHPAPEPQPEKASRGIAQAFILSKVVWQKEVDDHQFLSGVQFLELTTFDRKRLQDFLAHVAPHAT